MCNTEHASASLPYSYGLAARARRIYNGVACSGGQGVRPSRRMLPLEATRPGLLGTPGLVYSSSSLTAEPLFAARPASSALSQSKKRRAARGHRPGCRRSKRSKKLPDDQQHHDHEHDVDDLAADPAHRTFPFGFARLKADAGIWSPRGCQGFYAGDGPPVRPGPPWIAGSKFTLSCRFAPMAGFRC